MAIQTLFFLFLIVVSAYVSPYSMEFPKFPHDLRFSTAEEPYGKTLYRLSNPLIGDDGKIYICSEKRLFAFEGNGSISWTVSLSYTCNIGIAPVQGGRGKIYLVAENRVLKINFLNIETPEPATEVFFGLEPGKISPGEIIGLSISNTKGELYSLSIRSPHFNWILDISSLDKAFSISPGNNGRLYVTIPVKALVLALDVSSGNILWQGRIGPLSAADYTPVVDSNGWLSIGSLDGFLYSFSPTGTLKKHARSDVTDSAIQVSPFLDCSGYAVYMSQTKMEGKISHTIGDYTYVSAMRPKGVVFTLLVPAIGSIYWSESYPGWFSYLLSESDLQHFVVDERILLAFVTASKTGNPLQCRAPYQKLASSCSQHTPKRLSFYTGNERAIVLFLFFESLLLIILAGLVRFCYIFWRKKKILAQSLGSFLEKRHSLQLKKRAFDRTITELEKNAGDNATTHNQVIEELGDLVRQREGIQKKLSTTYSLGRDLTDSPSKSFLPIYNGKARSYSFQIQNKESVTIFHTLNDTSCSSTDSSWNSTRDIKGKQKANIEEDSSSDDGIDVKGFYRSPSEPASSSRVNLNQFV